jgi:predicted DNA-binding ribbon-helix-helix protein
VPEKHSISIRGHRTSFSLEEEFWSELNAIAKAQKKSTSQLITDIDASRNPEQNLSSALRVYVFNHVKNNS